MHYAPIEDDMTTLTVTAKGQVTLKRDLLRHLGIGPGDKVTVSKRPGGGVEIMAARGTGKISDIFGMFGPTGRPAPTIEEINEVIADSWAGGRGPWPE